MGRRRRLAASRSPMSALAGSRARRSSSRSWRNKKRAHANPQARPFQLFTRLCGGRRIARSRDNFTVFFQEAANVRIGKYVEHCFGWTAELGALGRDDNRPVDQDGMGEHEIEQLLVRPFRIPKPQLGVR